MTALPWPNKGELDIIEGANGQGPNLFSLHTGAGCRMSYQPSKMKVCFTFLSYPVPSHGQII